MDHALVGAVVALLGLILLDLAALRFGRDSRRAGSGRRDWW